MVVAQLQWCSVCRREAPLEAVPCLDGHGSDCPELLCVECGTVALVGDVLDGHPGHDGHSGALAPVAKSPGRAARAA